ncbi:MAG: helix-hairpin-helix domain-containing protein [Planctomycetota bacterium]|nr:helix-hairpin-helix domain-containing protein [Planctomycetota bacterium]
MTGPQRQARWARSPRTRRRAAPGGMALVAVLMVVTLAALIATSVVLLASGRAEASIHAGRQAQARLVAWSGAQAVVAELQEQRETLLRGGVGEPPELIDVFAAGDDGLRGVATLEPLASVEDEDDEGPGFRRPASASVIVERENGKLNVNVASEAMLDALPGVSAELASAIVRGRPFTSIEELLRVPGMSERLLFGGPASAEGDETEQGGLGSGEAPAGEGEDSEGAQDSAAAERSERTEDDFDSQQESADRAGRQATGDGQDADGASEARTAEPLVRWLTACSFEPSEQLGVGARSDEFFGERKIDLSGGWTDDVGDKVSERLGEEFAAGLKRLLGGDEGSGDAENEGRSGGRSGEGSGGASGGGRRASGVSLESLSDVVAQLRQQRIERALWGAVLDAIVLTPDEYLIGRIDLNAAPEVVLACVPGLESASGEIVRTRDQLDEQSRLSPMWLLERNLIDEEQFQRAIDWITTRSLQHRVRVRGVVERVSRQSESGGGSGALGAGDEFLPPREAADADERGAFGAGSPSGGGDGDGTGVALAAVTLDVIVDLSEPRARVALLREVTDEASARALARLERASGEGSGRRADGRTAGPGARDSDADAAMPPDADEPVEAAQDEGSAGQGRRVGTIERAPVSGDASRSSAGRSSDRPSLSASPRQPADAPERPAGNGARAAGSAERSPGASRGRESGNWRMSEPASGGAARSEDSGDAPRATRAGRAGAQGSNSEPLGSNRQAEDRRVGRWRAN